MLFKLIGYFLVLIFRGRQALVLENIALRQQLIVQQRSIRRHQINNAERIFWACLSKIWYNWKSALIIVKPETVVGWHRKGFKYYWRRKSQRVGRPQIDSIWSSWFVVSKRKILSGQLSGFRENWRNWDISSAIIPWLSICERRSPIPINGSDGGLFWKITRNISSPLISWWYEPYALKLFMCLLQSHMIDVKSSTSVFLRVRIRDGRFSNCVKRLLLMKLRNMSFGITTKYSAKILSEP